MTMSMSRTDANAPARPVRRRRTAAAVLALTLAGVTLSACGPTPEDTDVAAINALRTSVALPELARSAELDLKAEKQAQRMANAGTIFHSKNLTSGISPGWTFVGENVAMAGSVEAAQAALEASPGHYENMAGAFTEVGVGVVTRNGTVYMVQVFVQR
jgi:uncharacterized protein YkwD